MQRELSVARWAGSGQSTLALGSLRMARSKVAVKSQPCRACLATTRPSANPQRPDSKRLGAAATASRSSKVNPVSSSKLPSRSERPLSQRDGKRRRRTTPKFAPERRGRRQVPVASPDFGGLGRRTPQRTPHLEHAVMGCGRLSGRLAAARMQRGSQGSHPLRPAPTWARCPRPGTRPITRPARSRRTSPCQKADFRRVRRAPRIVSLCRGERQQWLTVQANLI